MKNSTLRKSLLRLGTLLLIVVNTLNKTHAQLKTGDPGVSFDSSKYDNRYPQIREWQKAGVRGGIPFLNQVKIVKTLNSNIRSRDINAAIQQASRAGEHVGILLKNGTYTIDESIDMKSNVSLIGESRDGVKCIITMNRGSGFCFNEIKNSGIYRLTIQGSWGKPKYDWNYGISANDELPNNDNISVKFRRSTDCWLDKVNIYDSGKDPVRVPSNHITLRDLKVDGAHKKSGGAQGYFFIQGAYNLITGCQITHLRHISLQGGNVEYNVVYDNDFKQEVSFHSGDKGNNLIENNRIILPKDMPNNKADTPDAAYNSSREPNYFAIMGPWSVQHDLSEKPNFIYNNQCLELNHQGGTPWSDPNVLYKGPKEVKPENPLTNFPAQPPSARPKGNTLYPIVLGNDGDNGGGDNDNVYVLPGSLEAEDYKTKSGSVRIENIPGNTGKNIGFIRSGDYTIYSVDIKEEGEYTFEFFASSAGNGGEILIEESGRTIATVRIPVNNVWHDYKKYSTDVILSKGLKTLKFMYNGNDGYLFNVDKIIATKKEVVLTKTETLSPIQDVFLQGSTRYNGKIVRVEQNNRIGYLMYDLSSISGIITKAELSFTVSGDSGNGNLKVDLGNSNNWTEDNLSVSNKPAPSKTLGNLNESYDLNTRKTVNLKASEIRSNKVSFIITMTNGNDFAFASKENTTAKAPELKITYTSSSSFLTQPVKEVEAVAKLKIYPNPATSYITVQGLTNGESVSIYDQRGNRVRQYNSLKDLEEIGISDLPTGFYYAKTSSRTIRFFKI